MEKSGRCVKGGKLSRLFVRYSLVRGVALVPIGTFARACSGRDRSGQRGQVGTGLDALGAPDYFVPEIVPPPRSLVYVTYRSMSWYGVAGEFRDSPGCAPYKR